MSSRICSLPEFAYTTIESAAMINGGGVSNYEPGKEKLLELKKMGVKIYPTNEAMAQALMTAVQYGLIRCELSRREDEPYPDVSRRRVTTR